MLMPQGQHNPARQASCLSIFGETYKTATTSRAATLKTPQEIQGSSPEQKVQPTPQIQSHPRGEEWLGVKKKILPIKPIPAAAWRNLKWIPLPHLPRKGGLFPFQNTL